MSKSLTESFDFKPIYNADDSVVSDYEVFKDKKLLDELRKIIIEDLVDKEIPATKELSEFVNEEIDKTFKNKAEEVIKYSGSNNIYTVKYKAYMENNILSLIIYSDLKQGTSAQRVIYETFTYDLKQNKKLTLQETLSQFSLKTQDIQSKINSDIKAEEEKNLDLKNLGYNVFTRDINNSIYKVENINEFFVYNGNIYIIFAYGNEQFTSQKDIVVI